MLSVLLGFGMVFFLFNPIFKMTKGPGRSGAITYCFPFTFDKNVSRFGHYFNLILERIIGHFFVGGISYITDCHVFQGEVKDNKSLIQYSRKQQSGFLTFGFKGKNYIINKHKGLLGLCARVFVFLERKSLLFV